MTKILKRTLLIFILVFLYPSILWSQSYGSREFDSLVRLGESGRLNHTTKVDQYLVIAEYLSLMTPDVSITLAEEVIKQASITGDFKNLNLAYLLKARSLVIDSKSDLALSWLQKASDYFSIQSKSRFNVFEHVTWGIYHSAKKDSDKAEIEFQKGVEVAQSLKNADLLAFALFYRGRYLRMKGEFEDSRNDYKAALKAIDFSQNGYHTIRLYIEMGNTFNDEGNYKTANDWYQKAINLSDEKDLYGLQTQAILELGWCLNKSFQFKEAKDILLKGISLSNEFNFHPYLSELYSFIADSYFYLVEYKESIAADKMSIQIMKSRGDRMNKKQLAEYYYSVYYKELQFANNEVARLYLDSAIFLHKQVNNNRRVINLFVDEAQLYINWGKFPEAKKSALKSLEYMIKFGDEKKYGTRVYWVLGGAYRFLGELDTAEFYANKANNLAMENNDKEAERPICMSMIQIQMDKGDVARELYYLDRYYTLSKEHNSVLGMSNCYSLYGSFYFRNGEYKKALLYFDSCIDLSRGLGNPEDLSYDLVQKARVYKNLGDYEKAATIVYQAIEIMSKSPEAKSSEYSNLLAEIYADMGLYKKSIDLIDQIISGCKKSGDKYAESLQVLTKSEYLVKQGHYDAAERYALQSLDFFSRNKHIRNEALAYVILAGIELKRNQLQNCSKYLDSAITKFANDQKNTGYTDALKLQAQLNLAKGNIALGLESIHKVIKRNEKEGRVNATLEALKIRTALFEKSLRYDSAYLSYLDYIQLRDSIYNIDTRNAITRKELQFEYDKKESVFLLNEKLANERIRNSEQELELSKKQILLTQTQLALKNKDLDLQKLAYLRTQAELHNQKISTEKQKVENQIKETRLALFAKQNELQKSMLESKKTERNALLAGMILIGMLLFFVSLNYYNQRKANRNIQSKNKSLSETLTHLEQTQSQLIESEKQKNLEIEKSRIARDMHDEIGSGLTKISLLSEVLKSSAGGNKEQVDAISKTAGELVDNMSQIIWAMNPETNKLENFFGYLRKYSMDFFENSPIECRVNVPENAFGIPLNQFVKRNLFLVIKESLNNVMKHSGSTLVKITATFDGNTIQISIADNGKGFDFARARTMGNGLNNLIKRMAEISGNFQIHSTPGTGTELVCSLQFKPKEEDEMMK